jgi:hypothetical protein
MEGWSVRIAAFAAVLALVLVGCGEKTEETATETTSTPNASDAPASDSEKAIAESDGSYANAPVITRELAEEWPDRWCRVRIGMTREQVVRTMGSYPTDQDSGKIPKIPEITGSPSGKVENAAPPEPAGSDTWEAPGTYQFNAFFDLDLRVQQLDFGGPAPRLSCPSIRVP